MTNYNYGGGNPMRPHRVRLTTNLVNGYGLLDKMRVMRPMPRTREEVMLFHADGMSSFVMISCDMILPTRTLTLYHVASRHRLC